MKSVLRAALLSIVFGLSLLLAGCGGGSASEEVVRVEAIDAGSEMPDQIEGGLVTMEFVNAGEHVHEWALGRLKEGRTVADLRTELAAGDIASLKSIEDVGVFPR